MISRTSILAASSSHQNRGYINDASLNESLLQGAEKERHDYYRPDETTFHGGESEEQASNLGSLLSDLFVWEPYPEKESRNRVRSKKQLLARSRRKRTEYVPPSIPERIDADKVLPINLELVGNVDTPPRQFFAKVFPWKKIQLQIAMKYDMLLDKIIADPNHEEGRLYNKATRELEKLHEEGLRIDRHIKREYIDKGCYKPSLSPLTDPQNAPQSAPKILTDSIAGEAAHKASDLLSIGRSFNFQL